MGSPFGLPSNYTSNPLYMQYMYQMMQNAMQQQQALFAQQQAAIQSQQAQVQAQQQAQIAAQQQAAAQQAVPAHQLPVDQTAIATTQANGKKVHPKDLVDDGKISGKKKFKNFLKGVGKFFTGMVCDENGKFSLKRTLTTLAVAAGATVLCVATGGAAAPFLVAAGGAIGAFQTGKGIYKAATAKTDAEAELAWQSIGSGTTAVVTAIAGAKGAMKAAGKVPASTTPAQPAIPASHQIGSGASTGIWTKVSNAASSAVKATKDALVATKDCYKIAGNGVWEGVKALRHPMDAARQVGAYWTNTMRPNLQNTFNAQKGFEAYADKTAKKLNKNISDLEAQYNKLNQEAMKNPTPERMAELQKEVSDILNKIYIEKAKLNNVNGHTFETLSSQRQNILKQIEALKKQDPEKIVSDTHGITIKVKDILKLSEESLKAINGKDMRGVYLRDRLSRLYNLKDNMVKGSGMEKTILNEIKAAEKALTRYTYMPAVKNTMKTSGLAAGSVYLATRDKTPDNQLTQEDLYAQSLGFANAAEMQNYLQALEAQEAAQAAAGQQTGVNNGYNSYNQYNPAAYNVFNSYMQQPTGNYLGFNDLYVSPYPEYI